MNTTDLTLPTGENSIVAKFKKPLQANIEKINEEVTSYNFKSLDNTFLDTYANKEVKSINGFTILTVLHRFFYTAPGTGVTYISNVIVGKDEIISFYHNKSKYSILGGDEHTFDELEKLSFVTKSLNRKVILVGIYEGKLTKIEAQVTSERPILRYLKDSNDENTVDISGVERKYKDDMVAYVLGIAKSRKQQLNPSEEMETEYFKDLDAHITAINSGLSLNGNTAKEPKKNVGYTTIDGSLTEDEMRPTEEELAQMPVTDEAPVITTEPVDTTSAQSETPVQDSTETAPKQTQEPVETTPTVVNSLSSAFQPSFDYSEAE